jgi:hypothetical protein
MPETKPGPRRPYNGSWSEDFDLDDVEEDAAVVVGAVLQCDAEE